MNWDDSDNKLKVNLDKKYVSCDEQYEKEKVLHEISKKNPGVQKAVIQRAIEECCKEVSAPRDRGVFHDCVIKKLGKGK